MEFDSRLIEPGDLFVPLGCDGRDFIETSVLRPEPATFSEKVIEGHPYVLVEDVLSAKH